MTEELKPMSLRDALRDSPCPRPANDQPADQNVGACVDKGLCGCQNGQALAGGVAQGQPDNDVRWAVNVLLERIAEKFEANDTFDIWRSDAAATVRSFKHDLASPPAEGGNGNRTLPFDRDTLGRMVREAWVRWAETQAAPKPSWLLPYDDLAEADKEADRQIGETIARWTLIGDAAASGRSPAEKDVVNNALIKARDEACKTIHNSHLHEVLIGFDLAAEAAMDAILTECSQPATSPAGTGIQESQAKEPEANETVAQGGCGSMGSSRHVAGRTATTTSENLDVTAGETAPFSSQPDIVSEDDLTEWLKNNAADDQPSRLVAHTFLQDFNVVRK